MPSTGCPLATRLHLLTPSMTTDHTPTRQDVTSGPLWVASFGALALAFALLLVVAGCQIGPACRATLYVVSACALFSCVSACLCACGP